MCIKDVLCYVVCPSLVKMTHVFFGSRDVIGAKMAEESNPCSESSFSELTGEC